MALQSLPWGENHGILRISTEFYGTLRQFPWKVLWCTARIAEVFHDHGRPQLSVAFVFLPWKTVECHGIPRHSTVFHGKR